ncbi:MAG: TrpR-like protein YerC/YecD [Ruminococcaceae bacterium]|nr:TrpR-like protein YerC/YecD [Oscillospiraceae bacterium]
MLRSNDLDYLFEAILTMKSVDECYRFFEDICTIKELQSMAQRMQVAKQLNDNKNYVQVIEDTGVSSATISRVNKCLQYGNGGYKLALDRLAGGNGNE